ncbi:hypothetical protein [Dyadobacter sp. CY326]|uniref:hypothetical protein n=1 Tax=Dyadobacter sp. CY326 TaxID=2907300 RepID=UPI001F336D19|nr:hypothetical protein [Dyadobacter sp. CY326]MCE7065518.1 hypothetical protein [Dyadobacter sp. CY326]
MKEIIDKLIKIEQESAAEKGDYELFALFLREESFGRWDIVVYSKWACLDYPNSRKYLSEKIQNSLSADEIVQISRIVVLDQANLEMPDFIQNLNVQHGAATIKDEEFLGQQIERGYVITANTNQAA